MKRENFILEIKNILKKNLMKLNKNYNYKSKNYLLKKIKKAE